MAKQLNVNLNVQANTQAAKAALNELNTYLSKVVDKKQIVINDTSINDAKQAAIDLKKHLDAATNVNTGKLDLSKFSASLTKSGQSLKSLHSDLSRIGPDGQSAFLALSKSIAAADASALTLGSKLGGLLTTLKNTARWQISSSILHGFMGTIQSAYGYAQDLNESLNNIRIVTGQSIDQMAKFADEANRAARALSTTTTAYTDAALIYYQQGLTGKAVTDRVEATVKLANVSRQSAEEVSSQMTAIWNNFDDGSKSLEYYADVITALGAATASSSDEIAQGLQKFAAVADTVGLSYEKATAALATVVAETRQSADVVGTAFKTMFARFQGVTLGETLEDGVGLNKYSKALETVGVNILEANGNLKDMDTILDELGAKWNQIGNAQQVALAETVAGTRQYAQFMAIMENYDKILANQQLGEGSEGTLQKQADIYSQSWEAASKRVKAALQEIYNQLLDDKFFITFLNGAEKVVDIISNIIDGLGGVKGILLLIGSIVLNKYAKEMPAFFEKMISNIQILTGKAEQNRQSMLSQNLEIINSMRGNSASQEISAQVDTMAKVSEMTLKLAQNRNKLSQAEIANYENKIKEVQIYGEVAAAIGKEVDQINKEIAAKHNEVRYSLQDASNYGKINLSKFEDKDQQTISAAMKETSAYKNLLQAKEEAKEALDYAKQLGGHTGIKKAQQELDKIDAQIKVITQNITGKDLLQGLETSARQLGKTQTILTEIEEKTKIWSSEIKQLGTDGAGTQNLINDMQQYIDKAKEAGMDTSNLEGALQDFAQNKIGLEDVVKVFQDFTSYDISPLVQNVEQFQQAIVALGGNSQALEIYIQKLKEGASAEEALAAAKAVANRQTEESVEKTLYLSEAMGRLAGAAMQLTMIFNQLRNIRNIINNDELEDSEKLIQILTSATMILPNVINLLNAEKLANLSAAAARLLGITGIESETKAHWLSVPAKIASGEAGWVALGPLLAFVAIAGGAIALIYTLAKAIETPAEKLKRLKKEQEDLNELTEQANQEWTEFKETLSNYDSALDGLSKLKEGTAEFNEELKKANDYAKELIAKLSLNLLEDYIYNDKGEITFTASGRQKIEQANQRILAGQQALAWAGYEKDRQVRAQEQKISDTQKLEEIRNRNNAEANEKFGIGSSGLSMLTSSLMRELKESGNSAIDNNGQIDLNKLNINDVVKFVRENYEGQMVDARGIAQAMINAMGDEGLILPQVLPTYENEKQDIVEFLGNKNQYANLIAESLFGNQENIQKRIEETKNELTPELVDELWDNTYGMLTDDQQQKLLKEYKDDKAAALLPGVLSNTYRDLAQSMSDNIDKEVAKFSKENKDVLTALLLGQTQKLSPEQLQGQLTLSTEEQAAFAAARKMLYGDNALTNVNTLWQQAVSQYDEAQWKKNQIQDIQAVQEKIKELNKAFASLKLGDTVESLEGLSEAAKTYFTQLEDGTYKLIGNVEQFKDILFKESTVGFEEQITQYQDLANTQVKVFAPIERNGVLSEDYIGSVTRRLGPEEQQAYQETVTSYAMASETLSQLNYVKEKFNELGVDTRSQVLAENAALQDLATKYESCTDDLEAYQHALATGNQRLIEAAKNTLEYSIAVGELSQKHGFDAKQTEAYAKKLKDHLAPSMKEAGFSEKQLEKSALAAAIANQRLDRGLLNLNKNIDSYKKSLLQADRNSIEWSNTIESLKTDLADILDMDVSVLTDQLAESFLTNSEYSALLTQALDGNVEAIKRLREIAADDIMSNIKSTLEIAGEDVSSFMTQWDNLKTMMSETMKSGGIDQTALVNSFNELIEKGHMTKDQIEAALAGMHVAADIETEYHEQETTVPTTITEEKREIARWEKMQYPAPGDPTQLLETNVPVYRTYTQTVPGKPAKVVGYVPTYKIKGTTGPGTTTTKILGANGPAAKGEAGSAKFISDTGESATQVVGEQTAVVHVNQPVTDAFSPLDDNAIRASFGSTTTGLKDKDKNKGGGSTKSNTKSVEEHIDEEHRYDELNKQLEGLSKQYDRLGKARDRAWGKNKIALLGQELDKLKQMQKVYERYLQTVAGDNWKNLHDALQSGGNIGALIAAGRAGGYLQKDFDKLISAAKGGIEYKGKNENGEEQLFHIDWQGLKDTFNIDLLLNEFGEIANKDDIEEAIEAWWNNHIDDINELEDGDEKTRQKNQLEAIRDYAKKALDQYADSVNTFTENSDKLLDNFYDQQDKFYENFRYKIDLKVEISERSLKRIEYAIKILGDNIYKVPEVMQAWFDERVTNTKDEVEKMGTTWTQAYADATAAHDQGLISDEDYIQTIKDAQDGLYGCIDSLLEINDEMREYYKNVLSKVKDEMARITDEMDHQLDTINHLTNVLSLLGRETDYAAIGEILDAQLQMSRNGYDVSKAQVEMYRRQVEAAQAELEQFVMEGISEEALEEWKNAVLYPAQEALREAESEMEADFEQYLEVIKARYENNINRIYQDSERRLTGRWGSFDELNKAMERQHALDEEYLTKTNQIYETNVLLKKLAQDLDKTNNNAAKTRIKNFSSEIEELQQKNKLSKSELEIAKARYEMLLAENALEDARNAKSTVRLQRDNEGNYGYVYTADSDKITAAEDEFEQKRNDLYNLVLGQANDYTEKIIQLNQQAYSELKDLDLAYAEGRIADEETYNRLRQDIIDKYNDLIQEDYESYYRALGWLDVTASTDHTEAWGTSFADILDLEEDFKGETSQVIQETGAEISELSALRAEATEEAKVGNGELEKQLGELTKANDDLAREMIDRVVPSAEDTLMMAQQLTAEWIRQYSAIMNLVSGYMALATAMNQTMSDMSGVADEGTGGLSFDSDFDYANAMRNWLLNGGSKDDEQYKQWEREREAKIDSMGLSQDYYGYRGDEFQNKLDTYIENDLEGYTIADAVDAFEQAGENLEQVSEQLNQLTSYGTGGFTGNWGSRGKLAVLHEKELVLNPADTENIVSAVGMLREFSSAIDLRAAASNLSGGLNSPNYEPGAQVVEQEVNIHAEFPNVTNHSEIEEAFNSLINRASQYASRY